MFAGSSFRSLSTRASSEVLGEYESTSPDSYPLRSLPEFSKSTTSTAPMAQPGYPLSDAPASTGQGGNIPALGAGAQVVPTEGAHTPEDNSRPSDEKIAHNRGFQQSPAPLGSIRSASRPPGRDRKQSNASYIDGGQQARLDFELDDDETASQVPPMPQRRPSRHQLMRYGPPPTPGADYGFDDRPYWPRPPYDYGVPVRGPPSVVGHDYWGEEGGYTNRPYRRMSSLRESDEWRSQAGGRGPPGPPRRRYRGDYEDPSEDGEEDEQPLRYRGRRRPPPSEKSSKSPPPEIIMRLPFTEWMNRSAKGHFVATLGEFMGTTMFLFFAFAGTQVANIGADDNANQTTTNASTGFSPIVLLYISLSFGFSLMVNVWIFFRISGGLFNPAVTLAMMIVKGVGIVRGILLIFAQIAGAIFGSYIVSVLFPTTFNVRTTLSDDTSLVRGVFIEAILTAELVFTIYMLANEKHKATFMAPVGIGLALFVAELIGVYYTGGSLNPARSFGPCVISGVWDQEHWIYWVGPCSGACIAWAFYRFIKMLEYEMANPGQEADSDAKAAEEAAEMTPKKEDV